MYRVQRIVNQTKKLNQGAFRYAGFLLETTLWSHGILACVEGTGHAKGQIGDLKVKKGRSFGGYKCLENNSLCCNGSK